MPNDDEKNIQANKKKRCHYYRLRSFVYIQTEAKYQIEVHYTDPFVKTDQLSVKYVEEITYMYIKTCPGAVS